MSENENQDSRVVTVTKPIEMTVRELDLDSYEFREILNEAFRDMKFRVTAKVQFGLTLVKNVEQEVE